MAWLSLCVEKQRGQIPYKFDDPTSHQTHHPVKVPVRPPAWMRRAEFASFTRSTDVLDRQFPSLHTTNAQTPNCRNCVEKSKMRARLHFLEKFEKTRTPQ